MTRGEDAEARTGPGAGHNHRVDGRTYLNCVACRQRAIDSNALAEIASKAITEASNGDLFVHLGLRYGVAHAVLDSDWLAGKITAAEARGAADERGRVLALLADASEALVERRLAEHAKAHGEECVCAWGARLIMQTAAPEPDASEARVERLAEAICEAHTDYWSDDDPIGTEWAHIARAVLPIIDALIAAGQAKADRLVESAAAIDGGSSWCLEHHPMRRDLDGLRDGQAALRAWVRHRAPADHDASTP